MSERVYIYAYDPKIGKRVVYVRKGNVCISLITGHQFTLTKKEINELEKEAKKK